MQDSHLATMADSEASRRRVACTTYNTSDSEAAATPHRLRQGCDGHVAQATPGKPCRGCHAGRSASKPRRGKGMDEDVHTTRLRHGRLWRERRDGRASSTPAPPDGVLATREMK
jgi:hypothetical protein